MIKLLQRGDFMTIKEIAEKTNVSVATVSRVINNSMNVKKETRERILQLLEENKNNYRYFASVGNKSIAVILPDIHNPFYGEIIRGVTRNAHSSSYDVLLYDTQDDSSDEISYLEKAVDQKVDGILLMSSSLGDKDDRLKDLLTRVKIPVVLIDKEIRGLALDGVFLDDVSGILQLTEALAGCGHRKITMITGDQNSSVTKKRISGFIDALQEFNLDYSRDQVIFASYTDTDIAEPVLSEMLARADRPTADHFMQRSSDDDRDQVYPRGGLEDRKGYFARFLRRGSRPEASRHRDYFSVRGSRRDGPNGL